MKPRRTIPTDCTLWTSREIATLLGLHPWTLRQWRRTGRGPDFIYLGFHTIRYRPADVNRWLLKHRRPPKGKSA